MIRIITETTYGHYNGKWVEPKTKNSEAFSAGKKKEAELVARGIAEYVEKQEKKMEEKESPPEDHNESETVEEEEPLPKEDVEITAEYLDSMSLKSLREFAEQLGIEKEKGENKEDFIKNILENLEADEEEPPATDAEESVIEL